MRYPAIGPRALSWLLLFAPTPAPLLANDGAPVSVTRPIAASAAETLTLSGSLSAERHASLSPRVDGLVVDVGVDAGSRVEAGEVLLRLDPTIAALVRDEARAASAEAQARLAEARRLAEEARRLRESNHISATEAAAREAALALARAAADGARARERSAAEALARHQLTAPFAGVISARHAESGEWVNRGDTVLELVALDPVRLDVRAPQERFADIGTHTPVTVLPDSRPGARLVGRVSARVPVSDPAARAFLVRVVIDDLDADGDLLPGTSATALFQLDDGKPRLLVPRDALLRHPDGGHSLFVVADGRAQRRPVTLGPEGPEGIAIRSGLDGGEQVVIRVNEVLRDGQPVTIIDQGP